MLLLSTKQCKELEATALICPVYNDFTFQLPYIRSYLGVLNQSVNPKELYSLLNGHIKQIGDFYLRECVEHPKPYRWIYFVLIRTFFDKPSFRSLSEILAHVLLDAVVRQFNSICLPPFDLDYLSFSTEMEILAHACLKSFELDSRTAQMNVIIPHIQNIHQVQEAFSFLPSELFQNEQYMHKKKRTNVHIRNKLHES